MKRCIANPRSPKLRDSKAASAPEGIDHDRDLVPFPHGLDRDWLLAGARFSGPALIEDAGSTFVIGPGAAAEVMPSGSIVVTLN